MNRHQITLNTRDGQSVVFECATDEDVLSAAEQQTILLPSQCHNGSCGACVASVSQGDYDLAPCSPDVLSADAQSHGQVLLCRTHPRSDLHINTPYTYDFIRFERTPERMAEISAIETVAPDTLRIVLSLLADEQHGQAAEFEPGQYMEIAVPDTDAWRAYSLANNTNWDGQLEMVIRLRTGGLFSDYLRHAQAGERLLVRGPQGTFTLQENGLRPRWFIGGGTGVVPLISMLRRMADWGDSHPARLYFAVRHRDELFFTEQLAALQAQLPQLQVKFCVSQPETADTSGAGNVIETLRTDLAQSTTLPDCYVCGSARLVQGVTHVATMLGVPATQLYSERFVAAP